MDRPVDPALVKRFRTDLAALWPESERSGGKLGVAVSGGPDSLALLLLAHRAMPGRVEAATVDHQLRSESAGEAVLVAGICRDLDIPHEILAVEVAAGNQQSAARSARYGALTQWVRARGLLVLSTAHHADDQAETLLMRLNRGSGLAALAGVRPWNLLSDKEHPLIRPLLSWTRAELSAIVREAGYDPAHDPSNDDPRFDRVRLRQALTDADWLDASGLARSAAHLSEAEQTLLAYAAVEWETQVEADSGAGSGAVRYTPFAPPLVRKMVVQQIVGFLGNQADMTRVSGLIDRLEQGQSGNIAGVMATPHGDSWLFERENPRTTG